MKLQLNRYYWYVVTILIAVPILMYYYLAIKYTINIPWWDEYGTALSWMRKYLDSSINEKLSLLFNQANEHRLLTYNLTLISDYFLFGDINFKRILIYSNTGMILLAFGFYKMDTKLRFEPLFFVPIIMLIFVPMPYVTDWSIVALVIIYLYFTILVSLYLLNKEGSVNFIFAIIFAVISTFSFGNGMFVFASGYIILFISQNKPFYRIIIWTIVMFLSVIIYFTDYRFSSESNFLSAFIQSPLQTIEVFLTFFGGFLFNLLNVPIYVYSIIGSMIFAYTILLVVFKWKEIKKHPVILSFLVFIVLTVAAMAVSRVNMGGIHASFAGRYRIVQSLYLAALYLLTINVFKINKKWFLLFAIIFSVVLYILRTNIGVDGMKKNMAFRAYGLISYYKDADNNYLGFLYTDKAATVLNGAIKQKIYNPPSEPDLLSDKLLMRDVKNVRLSEFNFSVKTEAKYIVVSEDTLKIDNIPVVDESTYYVLDVINQRPPDGIVEIESNKVAFAGWAIDKKYDTLCGGVFIEIGDKWYKAEYGYPRQGVANIYGEKMLFSGFRVIIDLSLFEKKQYAVKIKVLSADNSFFYKPKTIYNIRIN